MTIRLAIAALVVAAQSTVAFAAQPPPAARGRAKAPGVAQLPNLRLDLKNKTIEFDGTLCHGDYPFELLVCQGDLRDYESMVSSPTKPSILHTALLALGLKPRIRDKKEPGKVLREGDPIDILLRFERDGKTVTMEPRELIVDLETKKHVKATPWIFYGSFFFPSPEDKKKLIYYGDSEQWLIGVLGDTASVIDLAPEATGKYGSLAIDLKKAPKKGTKVTLIIRPAANRKPTAPAKPQPAKAK